MREIFRKYWSEYSSGECVTVLFMIPKFDSRNVRLVARLCKVHVCPQPTSRQMRKCHINCKYIVHCFTAQLSKLRSNIVSAYIK